jgi:hypothetical protein
MTNPHEYTIQTDRDGFWIMDEYGEDVTPTQRYLSYDRAKQAIAKLIEDYEPTETGDAWTGGFADNH